MITSVYFSVFTAVFHFIYNIDLSSLKMSFFLMMNKKGRESRELKQMKEAFDSCDKDGDGKLCPEEWLEVLKMTGVNAEW